MYVKASHMFVREIILNNVLDRQGDILYSTDIEDKTFG